jgi:hypothetical protein
VQQRGRGLSSEIEEASAPSFFLGEPARFGTQCERFARLEAYGALLT